MDIGLRVLRPTICRPTAASIKPAGSKHGTTVRQVDLLHFWNCRLLAIEQLLLASRPQISGPAFRQSHELYLLYLQSFLDLTDEISEGEVLSKWAAALGSVTETNGDMCAAYLRELRNSAIKRGVDVTAGGQSADGVQCAVAPKVLDRSKEREYAPFEPWLRNVFYRAELAIVPAVREVLLELTRETKEAATEADLGRMVRRGIVGTDHMPTEIKIKALQMLEEIELGPLLVHQVRDFQNMLDYVPDPRLRVMQAYRSGREQDPS